MAVELPLPPHWDPARVEEVWRVDVRGAGGRGAEVGARSTASATPAADERRVALLLVDVQNTFCTPGFELFVPGAPDDNRRLCEFVYRNLGAITQIVPTLDTHKAMQVFHAAWLVNAEGRHPSPYTVVSAEDVENGVWWAADPAEQQALLSLRARARGEGPVSADDLAVPRDARRDRPRARLGGRGGGLLPRDRPRRRRPRSR